VGSWTLSTTAGTNTLTATSSGLTGSPVTFTAEGTAGAAGRVAFTTAPSSAGQSGVALAQQPVLERKGAEDGPSGQAGGGGTGKGQRRDPEHGRERDRHCGELDPQYDGGDQHAHGRIERAHREPGHLHRRRHGRGGGAGRLHDGALERRAERGSAGSAAGATGRGYERTSRQ